MENYKTPRRKDETKFWNTGTGFAVGFLAGIALTYGCMIHSAIKDTRAKEGVSYQQSSVYSDPNGIGGIESEILDD